MVATILRIQVLATLNGPRERAAFERKLKELGLANKPMLTQEELTRVGLACAAEVATGLAVLTPKIREQFGLQMQSVMEAHERRDPEALDDLALIFRQTFKATA
ncbi:MAG: hypothetical protein JWM80_1647 [Cyanobacteria bacterium RYN_339]|nr:hypothetical protein [Cyanobacteria bacterium RYN_339]